MSRVTISTTGTASPDLSHPPGPADVGAMQASGLSGDQRKPEPKPKKRKTTTEESEAG